jgi:hypothetical protein
VRPTRTERNQWPHLVRVGPRPEPCLIKETWGMEYAEEGLQTKPSSGPVRGTFGAQSIRSLGRDRGGGVCLRDGGRGGHDEPSSSSLDREWVPPAGAHSGCWDESRDHAPHAQVRQSQHDHLTMLFGICQGFPRHFVRYLFWLTATNTGSPLHTGTCRPESCSPFSA